MRRRISLLVAVVAVAGSLVLSGPTPRADASLVCGGLAGLTVVPGLPDPMAARVAGGTGHLVDVSVGALNHTHGFLLPFGPGTCAHLRVPPSFGSPSGSGVLKGYCGHFSGTGTVLGRPFAFVSTGALLVLTGHVSGLASVTPTPADNFTCGRADGPSAVRGGNPSSSARSSENEFLLALIARVAGAAPILGVASGLDCSNALPPAEQLQRVADSDPLVAPTGTPLVGAHVHVGVHLWTMQPCVGAVLLG